MQGVLLKDEKTENSQQVLVIVQQLRNKLKKIDLSKIIKKSKKNMSENMYELVNQVWSTPEGEKFMHQATGILKKMATQHHHLESRKRTFILDCLREATVAPFIKKSNTSSNQYNFLAIYLKNIDKQLRRLIWARIVVTEENQIIFHKQDHYVNPYNLRIDIIKKIEKIYPQKTFKQTQTDLIIRLLQYVVKKQKRLPQSSHIHLAVLVIQVFNSHNLNRILQIGAIYVGFLQIITFYEQFASQDQIQVIIFALDLIDSNGSQLIQKKFLIDVNSKQSKQIIQFLSCFGSFKQSLGSIYLSHPIACFIIDQLLIRTKNALDIYIYFAIMLMILSQAFQNSKEGIYFRQIIEDKAHLISTEDFIDACSHIYQRIPPRYDINSKIEGNNRLYQAMIKNLPNYSDSLDSEQFTQNSVSTQR